MSEKTPLPKNPNQKKRVLAVAGAVVAAGGLALLNSGNENANVAATNAHEQMAPGSEAAPVQQLPDVANQTMHEFTPGSTITTLATPNTPTTAAAKPAVRPAAPRIVAPTTALPSVSVTQPVTTTTTFASPQPGASTVELGPNREFTEAEIMDQAEQLVQKVKAGENPAPLGEPGVTYRLRTRASNQEFSITAVVWLPRDNHRVDRGDPTQNYFVAFNQVATPDQQTITALEPQIFDMKEFEIIERKSTDDIAPPQYAEYKELSLSADNITWKDTNRPAGVIG